MFEMSICSIDRSAPCLARVCIPPSVPKTFGPGVHATVCPEDVCLTVYHALKGGFESVCLEVWTCIPGWSLITSLTGCRLAARQGAATPGQPYTGRFPASSWFACFASFGQFPETSQDFCTSIAVLQRVVPDRVTYYHWTWTFEVCCVWSRHQRYRARNRRTSLPSDRTGGNSILSRCFTIIFSTWLLLRLDFSNISQLLLKP